MQNPSAFRSFSGAVAVGIALFVASPAAAASLTLTVGNTSANGTPVYAALCSGGLERADCSIGERRFATGSEVKFEFTNVPPGRYAVLAFQDLNNSGSLDRSKLGLPLEPYALSNGAGRRGRPTFEQAAISLTEPGRTLRLDLTSPKPATQ